MANKKSETVPICISGWTGTISDVYKMAFRNGAITEELKYRDGSWYFSSSVKNGGIIVDHATMDIILIGWYNQFDNSSNGSCRIELYRHSKTPVITYRR